MILRIRWSDGALADLDRCLPAERDQQGRPTQHEWLREVAGVIEVEFGHLWEGQVRPMHGRDKYRLIHRYSELLGVVWHVEAMLTRIDGERAVEITEVSIQVAPPEWDEPSVDS